MNIHKHKLPHKVFKGSKTHRYSGKLTDTVKPDSSQLKLLSDLDSDELVWLVSKKERNEILQQVGYKIDQEDFLVDLKTNTRVTAEDGFTINVERDQRFSLIAGSHHFVRNVAGYVKYLVESGELLIHESEVKDAIEKDGIG